MPNDTRADLIRKVLRRRAERMVARYVDREFSMRSAVGRMAIDETRLLRKQAVEIDIENATHAEILTAIYQRIIRRAVFARPEAPKVLSTEKYGDGYVALRRVMPTKDVAQIVRPKSKHASSESGCDMRDWRTTVATKLARLKKKEASDLIEVAQIRNKLTLLANQLFAARSEAGRLKRGGRNARNLRKHADDRVAELKSREMMLSDRRNSLIRGTPYRTGLDRLVVVCTVTEEVEAYCFGDDGER